jgi:putative transposase
MKIYEFRLRPTVHQEQKLYEMMWLTKNLYNKGLEELIEHYKKTGKHLNRFSHDKIHNKKTDPDLPAVLVDTTIARLHVSFANFFRGLKASRKVGFPRFRSIHRWTSFEFRDAGNYIEGSHFHSGKACAGNIKMIKHREMEGTFKHARIVKRPSGWYVQCICALPESNLPKKEGVIGLDFGLKSLVVDSNGTITKNDRTLRTQLKKLRRAQRKVSRRVKGSHNRKKAVHELARLHERIQQRRKDYLHKVSRRITDEFGTIFLEDLQISNMVKNHHLALSISDASWGMLRQFLTYKAEYAGGQVIAVAPHYTSQKCSNCGEMVEKSLSVRTHLCSSCGYCDDRDVNAAKNILRLGLSLYSPSVCTSSV